MLIKEVVTVAETKLFLDFARSFYQYDKNWICPLDNDINQIFDAEKNVFFKTGNACRWILFDDNNKPVGRIAAFFNTDNYQLAEKKIGGVGFFECIDNQEAANTLFNTALNWLKNHGVEGMDGPINFGEKDKFWGLMISGFKNVSYQENYNPIYYQKLYENYGFEKILEQTTSEVLVENFDYERFNKLASRVFQNPNYTFEHYSAKNRHKYVNDFITIYNQAWAHRPDFVPMTAERIENTLISIKPILMEDAIWFAYANGEPSAFFVNVIDINQIFRHLNGKLNLLEKIKLFWHINFTKVDRLRGIVFGVIPKYQNTGLETGMIINLYNTMKKHHHIRALELAWIGDFNPKMHSLFKALGAETSKIHYTYRYNF